MSTRTTAVVVRSKSARILIVVLLCAGCVGPIGRNKYTGSCSAPVDVGEDCNSPTGDGCWECESPACSHCGVAGTLLSVPLTIAGTVESLVCWPGNKCRHIINFCAPDDYAGPPPIPGPGRLHPVPTHPVFQHGCAPETSPAE